jgi:hypothetical protein
MLCAWRLLNIWKRSLQEFNQNNKNEPDYLVIVFFFELSQFHIIALFKVIFTLYLGKKLNDKVEVNRYILQLIEEQRTNLLDNIFRFVIKFLINKLPSGLGKNTNNFLYSQIYYDTLREELENTRFIAEDIDNIELEPKS